MFLSTQTLLLLVVTGATPVAAVDGAVSNEWFKLGQYLLGMTFVLVGLHFLLYSHLATHHLMKQYLRVSTVILGDILSCDERSGAQYTLSVLYSAQVNQFAERTSSRLEFRYPEAMQSKRFMRRFYSPHQLIRGTKIELLLLPGVPRSALTRTMVEDSIASHSHLRTLLILIPGSLLVSAFLYAAVDEIKRNDGDQQQLAWIGSVVYIGLVLAGAQCYMASKFRLERQRRFTSAVAMTTKNSDNALHNNEKKEPLLA